MTIESELKISYQNDRGMRTKLKHFYICSSAATRDIVCISETWLNENYSDGEVVSEYYNIFRKDRSTQTSDKKICGGVLKAVINK